jgi:hypothetical protein
MDIVLLNPRKQTFVEFLSAAYILIIGGSRLYALLKLKKPNHFAAKA